MTLQTWALLLLAAIGLSVTPGPNSLLAITHGALRALSGDHGGSSLEDLAASFRRLGMPEGIYPLAHCALYLACAPKSNAVKNAWQRAKAMVDARGALPVPKKLRNAPTRLMKDEGYGAGYKYAHDYEDGVVPGETYLPDELEGERFYEPTDRGEENRIRQRLAELRRRGG